MSNGYTLEFSSIDPFQLLTMLQGAKAQGWPPHGAEQMISEIKSGLVAAGHLPEAALASIDSFGTSVRHAGAALAEKVVGGVHEVEHSQSPSSTVHAAIDPNNKGGRNV